MNQPPDPSPASTDGDALLARIQDALARSVRAALLRHKQIGNPVAIWRDGKVVWIDPADIPIDPP